MELIINGETIAEPIEKCIYDDYVTNRADALEVRLDDSSKYIEAMRIKKGDIITAEAESIKTGKMFISNVGYAGNSVIIRALSTDAERFKEKTQFKESISFEEIIKEVAGETGYEAKMIHTLNLFYKEVQRQNETPISYLAKRLALESFQMKVNDEKIIIFDERIQEQKNSVGELDENSLQGIAMSTSDAGLIASIENRCKAEDYTIHTIVKSGLPGKTLEKNILCNSIAESERFCRAIMREANKYEFLTSGRIDGLSKTAGQTIDFDTSKAGFSGKKYIYRALHDLSDGNQMLFMRNVVAGGY